MKLLFERWRKHLKEDEQKTKVAKPKVPEIEPDEYSSPYEHEETDEETREKYFGTGPDSIECIKDLRDPKKFIKPWEFYSCMSDEGYEKIQAGSFRVAFTNPSNPDLVLKVVSPAVMLESPEPTSARIRGSMNMNKAEARASYQTASDLVPKVYDSAKDYFWIMSEKVTPITTWRDMQTFFTEWNGEDPEEFKFYFHKLISEYRNEDDLISVLQNRPESQDYIQNHAEDLVDDPLILQIRDLLAQFNAPTWDIRPHNVGYATRDGKKQFVILDPGFELTPDTKEDQPEDSEDFSKLFKDKYVATAPEKPGIEKISENWRVFTENTEIKGPDDFLYDITTSSDRITITLLDSETKKPVESKQEGTNAYISLEKRTDVPHWEVAWSSSPKNSEKVGTEMYLMALELAKEGLSPDSYETSDDASRVWAKFMKNNEWGVEKEKKEEFAHENDENPFFFVFSGPRESILAKYSDNITQKDVESEETTGFDPETEEYVPPFDPNDFDWEELDYLQEKKDKNNENDVKKVSKVVIYKKNGQILLLKRADGRNDWDLPGGHLKKGESYEEGAARETKEETNLRISGLKPVSAHKHIHFFKVKAPKGKIQLQKEEHVDYKWVNPKKIDHFDLRKSLKDAILDAIGLVQEQTEPYQRFSRGTYRVFINKLGRQGKNKYNVGGKMKKPSAKHLKSAPPGA